MTKLAIFCAESSLNIGTGHIMRCLVLAEKLQQNNWQIIFVTSKTSLELIAKLKDLQIIDPQNFYANPLNCDLLVIDNYSLDKSFEKHFKNFAKKILVIDDLANREHECDILLDQNLGTEEKDYENLVNKNCKILTGTAYCLLREEFLQLRTTALEKRKSTKIIKNILVNFGGSDIKNHSLKALQTIENSDFLGEIDVVLGFQAIHLKSINDFANSSKNKITIHTNANMAKLIFENDLAFAAGGSSAWERCCLGLPTFLVKIADNQEKIFAQLGQQENFNDFFDKVSSNYQFYVKKISDLADGKGSDRVVNFINQIL